MINDFIKSSNAAIFFCRNSLWNVSNCSFHIMPLASASMSSIGLYCAVIMSESFMEFSSFICQNLTSCASSASFLAIKSFGRNLCCASSAEHWLFDGLSNIFAGGTTLSESWVFQYTILFFLFTFSRIARCAGVMLTSSTNINFCSSFDMSSSSSSRESRCRNPPKCAGSLPRVAWRMTIDAAATPSSFSEQ